MRFLSCGLNPLCPNAGEVIEYRHGQYEYHGSRPRGWRRRLRTRWHPSRSTTRVAKSSISRFPERLDLARKQFEAEAIDYTAVDSIQETLRETTGDLDPSYLITRDMPLEDAVHGYNIFKYKQDGCIRAVFRP